MSFRKNYKKLSFMMGLPWLFKKYVIGEKLINIHNEPLHPYFQTMFHLQKKSGQRTLDEVGRMHGPEAVRKSYRQFYKLGALTAENINVSTQDIDIASPAGNMKARIYIPEGKVPDNTLIYYHGGGFVIGDIEAYDWFNKYICQQTGCTILFPEYRLAPENPYPAAPKDAIYVFQNIDQLGKTYHFKTNKVFVSGDSAGGNLAAVVAHHAVAHDEKIPDGLWLLFPKIDSKSQYSSYTDYAAGFGLSKNLMDWFAAQYLEKEDDLDDPLISPIFSPHLSQFPPTLLSVAGYDPLRGEGAAFNETLQAHGVEVTYRLESGMPHGFTNMFAIVPKAKEILDEHCKWIAEKSI